MIILIAIFNNTTSYFDLIPETESAGQEQYAFRFSNAGAIRFDSPDEALGKIVGSGDLRFPARTNIPTVLDFIGFSQMRVYAKSLDIKTACTVHITGLITGATTTVTLTVNATR